MEPTGLLAAVARAGLIDCRRDTGLDELPEATAGDGVVITEEEYLKGELMTEIKHEYIDGYVYAMSALSKSHDRIAGNVFLRIRQSFEKTNLRTVTLDMKVKVGTKYFYPDVTVSLPRRFDFRLLHSVAYYYCRSAVQILKAQGRDAQAHGLSDHTHVKRCVDRTGYRRCRRLLELFAKDGIFFSFILSWPV